MISLLDTSIVLAYFGAMIAWGIWLGRGQRDLSSYLLGGRDMPWWAILGSIVATETSTATFLSVPGIAFAVGGDFRFLQLAFGYIIGRVAVTYVLLPLYFRGNLFTAYEVLEQRFGGWTKQVASLIFLITRNLGDGLRLFLTGIVLEKVAGIDLTLSIVLIGLATIVYTFFGGMKAVVWSDCIQLVVYMLGGAIASVLIIKSLDGGLEELWKFAGDEGKLRVFDFRWKSTDQFQFWSEPFTFWAGLCGGAVLTLGTHGTDQMMVQRYLSARSQSDAARAVVLSGIVVTLQFALFLFLGVGLACFYAHVKPEVAFERPDEVFATFIVNELPIGLIGLTLAAVFSAATSTLSSSLNSSASAAINDFYLTGRRKELADSTAALSLSRRLTVFFGLVQIAVGIGASHVSRSVVSDALAIAGFSAGILLGVFLLGVLTKRVGRTAAVAGMLGGVVVLAGVKFGPIINPRVPLIAWPWYSIIGATTTIVTGLLVSLIVGDEPHQDRANADAPPTEDAI
jgi:SSS family transporter